MDIHSIELCSSFYELIVLIIVAIGNPSTRRRSIGSFYLFNQRQVKIGQIYQIATSPSEVTSIDACINCAATELTLCVCRVALVTRDQGH